MVGYTSSRGSGSYSNNKSYSGSYGSYGSFSSGYSSGFISSMIISNPMMRSVLSDKNGYYYNSYSNSGWKLVGECLGICYSSTSFLWAATHYSESLNISTVNTTNNHIYELYHKNNRFLGSIFYMEKDYMYNYQTLHSNLKHKISEIATQSELDVFLSTHKIVPNTLSITFPVKLLEYKFPYGVFRHYGNNLLHTNKSVLQRVSVWRSLFPGTCIITAATIISSLW